MKNTTHLLWYDYFMNIIQALYLGIIEGLTEFLPISSTGHLILASHILKIAQTDFLIAFEVAIQLGAIGAVLYMYWKRIFTAPMIKRLAVAFIPTGIAGFVIYPHLKALLTSPLIVGVSLFVGGIIILFVENSYYKAQQNGETKLHHDVSVKQAFLLGLYQVLAMIPGVSRSGSVIVGGLLMKLDRSMLTEFTFLLAVPTMSAATLYSIYKHADVVLQTGNLSTLAVGMVTSFVIATFVIKLFLDYVRKHTFVAFGFYRIIVGIIVFAIFFPR
ncbi:MAG: undecaprenyl-diphosphatase UppP [Candidatus Parcubacteria bacterium]|jgi:undecaprenyl-diphosphatase